MTIDKGTWKQYYFSPKYLAIPTKWSLLRKIGKDKLSQQAQLKLEWIIFHHAIAQEKATITARHFGIARKTLYKWLKRFDERNLSSLEEVSRAPTLTRKREITLLQNNRIKRLRKEHLRWGKMKLQKIYQRTYGEYISSWKIQKVIEQEQLYFDKVAIQRQRKRRTQVQKNPKRRITTFVRESKVHHLWHVDTVIFTLPEGGYRYLLTAIDDISKLAYARLYKTHSSEKAADFLRRLHYLTEGEIINLHHDNGSEFQDNFEKACKELSLPQ